MSRRRYARRTTRRTPLHLRDDARYDDGRSACTLSDRNRYVAISVQPLAMRTPEGQQTHPLKPASRWSGTYTRLRDAIFAHRLAPGTKLPEDELASIYSVG